jgi:hypothetical protein
MRQRLGIAAALLRSPRLLILDEPATGLDPAGMRDMRTLIRRLAGEGMTVLLSSHQLPEVQELCDRVAIVDSGRVVYEGALADLRRQGGTRYRLRTRGDDRALGLLRSQPGIEGAVAAANGLEFSAQEHDVGELSLALARAGIAIPSLTPQLATLEDLFFRLTEGADGTDRTDSSARPPGAAARGRQPRRGGARGRRRRGRVRPPGALVSSTAARAPALAAPARGRTRRPSTLTVYRWELRKLVSQKRTYLGMALIVALPLIFVLVEGLRHHHDSDSISRPDNPAGLATPVLT